MADDNVSFKRVGHRSVRDASQSEDESEAEEQANQVNTVAKETQGYVANKTPTPIILQPCSNSNRYCP